MFLEGSMINYRAILLIWLSLFFTTLLHANEPNQKPVFRNYQEAPSHVKEFYKAQHINQTLAFSKIKFNEYHQLNHGSYEIWEALELLSALKDESDPDLDLPQIQHALQTAEAMRKANQPDWMILTGLIHDLGKMLSYFGEPQWAVVGDTYPLGCKFSDKIVHAEYFKDNPDMKTPLYQTKLGVYGKEGVGLDNVVMTWGHDEYLYQVVKDQSTLPEQAKFMIRYHSFYALHKEGEYQYLLNSQDKKYLHWLNKFNQYDLYSKSAKPINVAEVKPYYEKLINKYFPEKKIRW